MQRSSLLPSRHTVVFCAIDDLIPIHGSPLSGFPDLLDGLAHEGIPCVWASARNRHQLDSAIRKMGQGAPFIAEGGCGVYLPEDYFHLKPARTVRFGRFTCIPIAAPQRAAREALETLAAETTVEVVPLHSLSPRELMQNTGFSRQEAEAIRLRDFDELFFFAGASEDEIQNFCAKARESKLSVRRSGTFWSIAVGASLAGAVHELRKLYDRALHSRAFAVAVTTVADAADLERACDRTILLTERGDDQDPQLPPNRPKIKRLPLFSTGTSQAVLEAIRDRQF